MGWVWEQCLTYVVYYVCGGVGGGVATASISQPACQQRISCCIYTLYHRVGTRQSVKFFLLSWELGPPQPLTRTRVCPPSFGSGGRGTLTGERGGGRVPIPTRGHILWYSLYVCTLCFILYNSAESRQRPNPKSLTVGKSRLWHRVKVDSGIGLPMVNVSESTLEWTYMVRL
jgi:hypothetical protein